LASLTGIEQERNAGLGDSGKSCSMPRGRPAPDPEGDIRRQTTWFSGMIHRAG
jgi:hypothetical protein